MLSKLALQNCIWYVYVDSLTNADLFWVASRNSKQAWQFSGVWDLLALAGFFRVAFSIHDLCSYDDCRTCTEG